jgi:hypothetical protein
VGSERRDARMPWLAALFAAVLVIGIGGLLQAPGTKAQGPDQSDVVLVFDFSASILRDKTNRNRFAAALERIADRVDQISADLTAGETTVSLVRFATVARDYPRCADLELFNSPARVAKFANCLRSVATSYRRGPTSGVTRAVGNDTNYVGAMQQAAKHLPGDSERPALILFTDGKHDTAGIPASRVRTVWNQLFGARTPFALLPVGMGLASKERPALQAGLEALRIVRDMPPCLSGATFDWPQVVFNNAADAGNAVAVALQDATCTFTVAPTPTPSPTPTPLDLAIAAPNLAPGDRSVELTWTPPTTPADDPIVDYLARCRPAAGGDWIESKEGVSSQPRAVVDGLQDGVEYACEVGVKTKAKTGDWVAAGTVTPLSRPAPPGKPGVTAGNAGLTVDAGAPAAGVSRFEYECSTDGGTTWLDRIDAPATAPQANVSGLTNGTSYVCRAYAANDVGISDPSVASDSVRPCGGLLDCNPTLLPIAGGLVGALVLGILVAILLLIRGRARGYVIAIVDVAHTANIGHGTVLGLSFTRAPGSRAVTGIVADRGPNAEIRIQRLRSGQFAVRDKTTRATVPDGQPLVVIDANGVRHSLVLQAFETNAASRVATRRP